MKTLNYSQRTKEKSLDNQVVEEVIECKTGNIQHTDPVQVNIDITLPMKDEKQVKLQESDPHTQQLRKQWTNSNLEKKHIHHGKQHPQMKNH